ncbi:ACP S-malonyltransferase [Gracilibacillus marinus]|jgi:[acyl-carrier-protein] S-malonyltransferase|uniref:Malonyl CoA-acyl carrier protein transacylase n=1 Tax=Gracilibacillus marinus TaxID=630535 RepID=A0ABV8VUY3_9BACI
MKKIAFVYPGQGSQAVGMGKDFYEKYSLVKEMFDHANEMVGYDLTSLMFEGPNEKLTETQNAQPSLLLMSAAITALLQKEQITPFLTAGHSLGEYSALVASNAISYTDGVQLVHKRGQLMENAYPKGQGSMAAVLGLELQGLKDALEEIKQQSDEVIDIANLNCPGQIVISGTKSAIEKSVDFLKEKGAKRVIPLQVSGPFHSSLMKPAAEEFSEEIDKLEWNDAEIPVIANVTASEVTDKTTIKDLLVKQLYSPVRFEETINLILEKDVDAIVEVGNGKVLAGLVKKVNRRTTTFSIGDVESYQSFVKWAKEE